LALIENLERDDWEEFFRSCFRYTLEVLKEDRFKAVGTSVDDLRAWLTAGGIARVRHHLHEQMEIRGLTSARIGEVNRCLEELVKEHRSALFDLMAHKVIPGSTQDCLAVCGFSELELQDLLDRLARGERPFEEWMYSHRHTKEEVAEIYRVIDKWLMQAGIVPPQFPPSSLN
jgi:hypothetical protein